MKFSVSKDKLFSAGTLPQTTTSDSAKAAARLKPNDQKIVQHPHRSELLL
jgi:hypothetical protein